MAKEQLLVNKIRKYVKDLGGQVYKTHGSGYFVEGFPDLLVVLRSGIYFVEAKAPGLKPTKVQVARIAEINEAGGNAWWCDSFNSFTEQL